MKNIGVYLGLFFFVIACAGTKKQAQKKTKTVLLDTLFANQFTGLLVVDAQNQDTLYDYNSDRYFIPASTTKIFTLYTAIKTLSDTIPALKYLIQNDTLYFEGTGDPTFLHPYFDHRGTLDFLKRYKTLGFYPFNFMEESYGPGWAWEDYDRYYQAERSALPIYGNVVTIAKKDSLFVSPSYFKNNVLLQDSSKNRAKRTNTFYYNPIKKDTQQVPYIVNAGLTKDILETALKRPVTQVEKMPEGEKSVLMSMASDSVYKRMMHRSDNFLAEQLLVLAASTLSDTLKISIAQRYVLDTFLSDIKQPPRWVDGSGLSRYNLFTPASMVHVLTKLKNEIPQERLFDVFAQITGPGTSEFEEPYIYAKSGSLGNTYNLAGYLITKSGKILIFSFMNNHFRQPTTEIKGKMHEIFDYFRNY